MLLHNYRTFKTLGKDGEGFGDIPNLALMVSSNFNDANTKAKHHTSTGFKAQVVLINTLTKSPVMSEGHWVSITLPFENVSLKEWKTDSDAVAGSGSVHLDEVWIANVECIKAEDGSKKYVWEKTEKRVYLARKERAVRIHGTCIEKGDEIGYALEPTAKEVSVAA